MMDLKWIIEAVTGANGAMIERTNVWENGIADMVTTWISRVRSEFKPILENTTYPYLHVRLGPLVLAVSSISSGYRTSRSRISSR
jgi:hypothetical protein